MTGADVRERRVAAGLSLRVVAAGLGISVVEYGRIERGLQSFTTEQTERLTSVGLGDTNENAPTAKA